MWRTVSGRETTGRFWIGRWAAALALAGVLAMWPACAVEDPPPGDLARLDFTLKDMHGKDVKLSDYAGRPLVVNFWATWCGPCKAEIPALVELVDKYRDQKLAVLGISVDDSPEDLRQFATQYKMNYPVLVGLGHDELQETYDAVMMIPITWFIRPDGTVFLKHPGTGTKQWFEDQVKAILPPVPQP